MHKIGCPCSDLAPLFEHGGGVAPASRRSATMLDFSVSINPLGPPARVIGALRENVRSVANYPDPFSEELIARLAQYHGVAPEQILAGNGSNELIYLIAQALRPRRVAIVEPTYTEYLRASLLAGAEVEHWLSEAEEFEPELFPPGHAELIWLCNPNNPTGKLWPPEPLRAWVAGRPDKLFVVDEAFLPFVADTSEHTLVRATAELPNLIVLRSMTKFYALPGLRLGYAVGSAALVRRVRPHQAPWSVNSLAQLAGPLALDDEAYAERSRHWCSAEAKWLHHELSRLGPRLEPLRPAANYVLARLQQGLRAADLADRLRQEQTAIRVAANFIGLNERYFRVAVRKREENERLLAGLNRSLLCKV